MTEFIFVSILMICFSTVLYLMVRALPRMEEEPAGKHGFLDRWAHSEIPEKVDAALNMFLLKFLRKVKVFVLKLDNTLAKHLQKIKTDDQEGRPNIDFREISGQSSEEKEK